jgi:D-alanyl-D-alanine carboxypeptidase
VGVLLGAIGWWAAWGPDPEECPAHLSIIRQGLESAGAIEAGDRYGAALAAGDFNGDGFADLAVGAPLENIEPGGPAIVNAGAVIISYGSLTGVNTAGATAITQSGLGVGSETGDNFGAALAVGRFNNDIYDDLAVGAPGETVGGQAGAGSVVVIYGGPGGLSNASSSIVLDQGVSPGLPEAGDAFGYSLAAGDFDGDGRDDLAVGIPGEDLGSGMAAIPEAGAVEFYFGTAGGITTVGSYLLTDDDTINPAQAGAAFGFSLAAGNIDGGPEDDLVVGIPGKNTSGPAAHGVIEVLFGGAGGISAAGAQLLNATSFGDTPSTGAQFGFAVAVGSATGDAFDDVAVGAPFRNLGSTEDVGRAYFARGSAAGVDSATGYHFGPSGSNANMNFAAALDFGDWTGDGYEDLAVGCPGANVTPPVAGGCTPPPSNPSQSAAGTVFIHPASGSGTGIAVTTTFNETQDKLNEDSEANDRFGTAVAFGAFAGGSRKALAIGAPLEDWEAFPGESGGPRADSGSVCIDMPWLQVQNLTCRCAILTNCNDEIVFSQKPFERHLTASTTKIMTGLLAVESTQPGCGAATTPCSTLGATYTVPTVLCDSQNWANGLVGGSDADLCAGEVIRLDELIRGLLYPSGNDAAFSIADLIYNPGSTCVDNTMANCPDVFSFVDRMNDRASELGLTRTAFENPSGAAHGSTWPSNNVSTPNDLARLGYFAMLNPLFYQFTIAGGGSIIRNNSPCFSEGAVSTYGGAFPIPGGAGPDFPNGSGIKSGSTPPAGSTYVASVDHPEGRFFTVIMGAPCTAARTTDVISLLTLGANTFCTGPFLPPPPPPGFTAGYPTQPVATGRSTAYLIPLDFGPDRAVNVAVLPPTMTPSASLDLVLRRGIQVALGPGQSATASLSPFHAHDGILITNLGSSSAQIQVVHDQPTAVYNATLAPGQVLSIAPYGAAVPQPGANLTVTHTGSVGSAILDIAERGYTFELELTAGDGAFQARMTASTSMGEDDVDVILIGRDREPGAVVDLILSNTLDDDPGCDGVLGVEDIPPFVLALLDPAGYAEDYPHCYIFSADRNGDGRLDAADISPFAGELLAPR